MISILDCTLRDGGYVNNWEFKSEQVIETLSGLSEAGLDIVECGFLDKNQIWHKESTRFQNIERMNLILSKVKHGKTLYVAMIEYGKYDIEDLPDCNDTQIDGIRFSFRKSDWQEAIQSMYKIVMKGYKLFVQPITTNSYTEDELNFLICEVIKLNPYACYIVDTQGCMFGENIKNIFKIFDNKLPQEVSIGLHSHNNLQLAYSNAIEIIKECGKRKIILDSSLYGMGRGAGNLNTELLADYLNKNYSKTYNIDMLLSLIDRYYYAMYKNSGWGYSVFHYLSATIGCHPDYASFLFNKKHLSMTNIKDILEKYLKKNLMNLIKILFSNCIMIIVQQILLKV